MKKVKEALESWAGEHGLSADDFLFVQNQDQRFYRAAKQAGDFLGSLLGMNPKELESQNISFYSGRHFYKTILNSASLGDIEEIFMGHSVDRNVRELYNHKDKRGEQELFKAAAKAIGIIDACLCRPRNTC